MGDPKKRVSHYRSSVDLDQQTAESLKRIANEMHMSTTALVRMIVSNYVDGIETQKPIPKNEPEPTSPPMQPTSQVVQEERMQFSNTKPKIKNGL